MKILAIASAGGHWIQLLRLTPAFEGHEISYMSTKDGFEKMVPGHDFYLVPDANRNDKIKLMQNFMKVASIIFKLRPDVIITTGAAPGLMGLIIGQFIGAKTIWVDSIANVESLSLSGKIASRFAKRNYTQWPELANRKNIYQGNIFS
jgi:UDP-N-acetylglucosamine:LPS N-acetylglucosamine transferase